MQYGGKESEIGSPPLTSIHPLSEDKASLLYAKHAFLFYAFCDDLIHHPEDKYLPIQRRKEAHAGTARPAASDHADISVLVNFIFFYSGSHRTMNPSLVTSASRTRIAEFNGTAIPLGFIS